ncbi:hypothetical protein VTL71DRAFT_10910 [Oculimacula yallundae]|uniref:Uncharacterized protein n=1 Tax=Oculimacula yallundae TaxID=86028 RepID=A0ABR4CUI5_9HELO
MLTFHLTDSSCRTINKIEILQSHFFAETHTAISEVLDSDDDNTVHHNFRTLLSAAIKVTVAPQWEAFGCFQRWLLDGIYKNSYIESSDIDVYLLSRTIQAHRFGNAVMEDILARMPARKYDPNSTKVFRQIFRNCEVNSLLRTLYLESLCFWNFSCIRNEKGVAIVLSQGQEFLNLEDVEDKELIQALREQKSELYPCRIKYDKAQQFLAEMAAEKVDSPLKDRKLEDQGVNKEGIYRTPLRKENRGPSKDWKLENERGSEERICKTPPWLKNRERFFSVT